MNAPEASRASAQLALAGGTVRSRVNGTKKAPAYPMKDPSQRARVALLFHSGLSYSAVAKIMGVTRQAAYLWHRRYRSSGATGLVPRNPTGAPPRFPAFRAGELRTALKNTPVKFGIDSERWSRASVAKLLVHLCGWPYTHDGAGGLLRRLGIDLSTVNLDLDRRLAEERL